MPSPKSVLNPKSPSIRHSSSKVPPRRSVSRLSFNYSQTNAFKSEKNQKHIEISSTKNLLHNLSKKELKQYQPHFQLLQETKNRKKRASTSNYKKQASPQNFKIEESKSKKYIINQPKLPQSSKTILRGSTRPKSSLCSLHSKALSNQTAHYFANSKSPSRTKLKKKTPQYIKSHTPTVDVSKSFSLFPKQKSADTTHLNNNSSQMELYKERNGNQSIAKLLNVDSFNSKELQLLRASHKRVLMEIYGQLAGLVAQVGERKAERIVGVMGGYEQIISELYQVLKDQDLKADGKNATGLPKTHPLPQHYDTADNSSVSNSAQRSLSTQTDLSVSSIDEIIPHSSAPVLTILKPQYSDSLTSNSLVKKLNLMNLKHSFHIKEYHDEFLQMKEGFSDSWKRDLEKERKF